MDGEKRKKTIMFIGSMIVALMFVTSYLAFGNNNSGVSTTTYTTTIKGSTLVVSGETNATIVNYTPNFRITLNNASQANLNELNVTLSHLLSNGSITNMVPEGNNSYALYAGSLDTYRLYGLLDSRPIGNYLTWNVTADVTLPNSLILYYGSHALNVSIGDLVFQAPAVGVDSIGSNILVNVLAQVYAESNTFPVTYSVYNNQIVITVK